MDERTFTGEPADYRPVSGLAVAALLAGCGSVLVLFTPLAAVLPLSAIPLAAVALADLRRSEGRRVGRSAALAGLALAVGFTTQAAASALADRWIMGGRATAAARAWIDAVREERLADAIGLCSSAALPGAGRDPFALPSGDEDPENAFRELPAVVAVAACGSVRPAVVVGRDPSGGGAWIARADLGACGSSDARLTLRLEPNLQARGRQVLEQWLVTDVQLVR